jgi:hypothetical protein
MQHDTAMAIDKKITAAEILKLHIRLNSKLLSYSIFDSALYRNPELKWLFSLRGPQ